MGQKKCMQRPFFVLVEARESIPFNPVTGPTSRFGLCVAASLFRGA